MTSPRPAPLAPRARLRTFLARGRAALPGWVFRSLWAARCPRRAAALTRAIPDLRPQHACGFDLRYDV